MSSALDPLRYAMRGRWGEPIIHDYRTILAVMPKERQARLVHELLRRAGHTAGTGSDLIGVLTKMNGHWRGVIACILGADMDAARLVDLTTMFLLSNPYVELKAEDRCWVEYDMWATGCFNNSSTYPWPYTGAA